MEFTIAVAVQAMREITDYGYEVWLQRQVDDSSYPDRNWGSFVVDCIASMGEIRMRRDEHRKGEV